MSRAVGIPTGCYRVTAEPDPLPVTFDLPRCCYAAWLDEDLMRQTETVRPARQAPIQSPPQDDALFGTDDLNHSTNGTDR